MWKGVVMVTVRAARPEDAMACAPMIYSAGPDVFNYFSGSTDERVTFRFLEAAFSSNKGEFGYANHWVAEKDGVVLGVAAGYSLERKKAVEKGMLSFMISYFGFFGIWGAMFRGFMIESKLSPPGPGEFMISHVGVAPEARSQGVGGALFNRLFEEGRSAGMTSAVLDVAATNPRAQALYERLGFEVTHTVMEGAHSKHGGIISHYRMKKPL